MFSGLSANQVSLDTVGHNITNASVDGYSRQNVNLAATKSQTIPTMYGSAELGTGVNTISVTRARDAFADKSYRKDSSDLNYADARQTNYDKLEAIYNDSTDTGVQKSINSFWSAWKALASDAGQSTTTTTRQTVVSAGDKLAQNLQSSTAKTQTLISDENTQLELQVKTVNGLTSDILDLNKQITQAESTGAMANDLRDSRDLKVDALSKLVKVSVDQKSDGSYSIVSNGNTLVDAHTRLTLKVTSTPNLDYGVNDDVITIAETGGAYDAGNGEIKGLQDSIAENKGYIDNMAAMGSYLLTTFNDQHKAGYDLNNNKGVNFYGETSDTYKYGSGTTTKTDSLGTTTTLKPIDIINSLTVNTSIMATNGTSLIAARTSGEGSAGAANATLLGGLLHDTADSASGSLGNTTFAAYYTGVTNKLGSDAQSTDNTVTNQEDLLTVSTNWRASTSGVNWDEELTNMIKFQKGYSSCARCLTTMDEMLDKLINSTGTVGR